MRDKNRTPQGVLEAYIEREEKINLHSSFC